MSSEALIRITYLRLDGSIRRLDDAIDCVKTSEGAAPDLALSRFLDARQAALDTMREVRDMLNRGGAV